VRSFTAEFVLDGSEDHGTMISTLGERSKKGYVCPLMFSWFKRHCVASSIPLASFMSNRSEPTQRV
jgi:hypothetical protein